MCTSYIAYQISVLKTIEQFITISKILFVLNYICLKTIVYVTPLNIYLVSTTLKSNIHVFKCHIKFPLFHLV